MPGGFAALHLSVRNIGASPAFVQLDHIQLRAESRGLRSPVASAAFVAGRIASGQAREGLAYFRQPPGDVKALLLRVGVRPHSIGADARFVEIACTIRG